MNLYLSSFGFGNDVETLKRMAAGRKLGFVPNALDHVQPDARERSNDQGLADLRELGIEATNLDLARYFARPSELEAALSQVAGLWIRGGNVFVLRKAMRLSGFDSVIRDLVSDDFLYAGYSAGICVLAPRLDGLQHVDDPAVIPYSDPEPIWDGLGILDYLILPHFQSEHPESHLIDKEVEYCQKQGIPFRAMRDGEVIVREGPAAGLSG